MYTIYVTRRHAHDFVRKEFTEAMLRDASVYCKASSNDEAKRYCNILKEKAKQNNVKVYIIPIPRAYSEDNDPDILVTFYSYVLTVDDILYTTPQIDYKRTFIIMPLPLDEYKNKLVMRENGETLGITTFVFPNEESTFQFIRDESVRNFGLKLRSLLLKYHVILEMKPVNLRYDELIDTYCLMLYTDRDSEEVTKLCADLMKEVNANHE